MNPGPKYVDKGYIPLVDNGVFEFIKERDMLVYNIIFILKDSY